jgi:hypothetical protein
MTCGWPLLWKNLKKTSLKFLFWTEKPGFLCESSIVAGLRFFPERDVREKQGPEPWRSKIAFRFLAKRQKILGLIDSMDFFLRQFRLGALCAFHQQAFLGGPGFSNGKSFGKLFSPVLARERIGLALLGAVQSREKPA